MIQFNLLPDVKLAFVKAQRIKHAVISGSVIAAGVSCLIFLLLFIGVHVVQKKVMKDQTADIARYSDELKETPDIDKVLTIQNQLNSLSALHADKPAAVRSFNLIQQMTPKDVSLTGVAFDYTANTVSFTGVASKLNLVNTMADTLKFTTYKIVDGASGKTFSNVVLSEFNRSAKVTNFKVTATYDPVIFDNANGVEFIVPSGISTSSVVGQPTTLFIKPTNGTTN